MAYRFPDNQTRRWTQPNNSDLFGYVAVSKNMNFDEEGYAKLAYRTRNLFDSSDDADFGTLLGAHYEVSSSRYYFLTDEEVFYCDADFSGFTQDVSSNVPTAVPARGDAIVYDGDWHVAGDDLKSLGGATWTASLYSLGGTETPMAVFQNRNELAIGQGDQVLTLDTSYVLQETLQLPDEFSVTSLDFARNRLWIGTRSGAQGRAYLFEWDGGSASANDGFPVGSNAIMCVKAYGDSVVVLTAEGELLQFNGGGFTPLARLPVYFKDNKYDVGGRSASQKAMHRSMFVEGDVIHINLSSELEVSDNNDLEATHLNDFPAGIWTYDPNVGLYHRYAPSGSKWAKTNAVTTANVNTTTDIITVAGATVPPTGTPVMYDDGTDGSGTAITELEHRKRYYVINESSTTMKLATTKANADADTAIDLTGTGNNNQYFVFQPKSDFGSTAGNELGPAGGIFRINIDDADKTDASRILFGGSASDSSTSQLDTLNTISEGQENRGYVITPRALSGKFTDVFEDVTIKYKDLNTDEDEIHVKYRVVERTDSHKKLDTAATQTATWSDSDTFTTTADLSDVNPGDEVEFVSGAGAGYCAHIASLSEAAGTWTVNLDEEIQNISASDTALFYVDNWALLGTITSDDNDTYGTEDGDTVTGNGGLKTFGINNQSKSIQLKIELRGVCVALEEIFLNNKPFKEYIAG